MGLSRHVCVDIEKELYVVILARLVTAISFGPLPARFQSAGPPREIRRQLKFNDVEGIFGVECRLA